MRHFLRQILFFSILSGILLTSCGKDDDADTTPPEVKNLKVNDKLSAEEIVVQAGTTAIISAEFSDNENLGSVKLNIHDDFDGHSHKIAASPFTFDTTYVLSGTLRQDTIHVTVPADVASGPYHLSVYLLDNSGNEAEPAIAEFEIQTGSQPSVTVSTDLTAEYHKGDTLFLEGTISDPDGLAEIHIVVEDHETATVAFEKEFVLPGNVTSWDIADALQQAGSYIILNVPGDHAEIRIVAEDFEGNLAVLEEEIHLH